MKYLKNEIKIHKKIEHPHLIKISCSFQDENYVYILMDYAENGNMKNYLLKKKKLTEKEAFIFFFQTCIAIDYLHKFNLIYRNFHLKNFLLDKKGSILYFFLIYLIFYDIYFKYIRFKLIFKLN